MDRQNCFNVRVQVVKKLAGEEYSPSALEQRSWQWHFK